MCYYSICGCRTNITFITITFLLMISMPSSPNKYANRVAHYNIQRVQSLLKLLRQKKQSQQEISRMKIKQDHKLQHSLSLKSPPSELIRNRPDFNNRTKQGNYMDSQMKLIPYVFIPGHKNDTFIMPDRVFEKGTAGKRFYIKMKDTSLYSFRDQQPQDLTKTLRKDEKEKTIISRQYQAFNQIIDQNDGVKKAQLNKWFLKTRKRFNPAGKGSLFSECQPQLEPKDQETKQIRKISLCKTFDFRNKWRPVTRGTQVFSATASNSIYQRENYASSVR